MLKFKCREYFREDVNERCLLSKETDNNIENDLNEYSSLKEEREKLTNILYKLYKPDLYKIREYC